MKFISLILIAYLAYYLVNILLDLLKLQKNGNGPMQAGGRLEIPIIQRMQHDDHVPVRVPVPTCVNVFEEAEEPDEKKSP
ncbi:MAG TPA: hypothetical protein VGZ71_16070 [Puia sp.]|jgi:hypothetical protein|nr:hypothetical protein [Puia sp.]